MAIELSALKYIAFPNGGVKTIDYISMIAWIKRSSESSIFGEIIRFYSAEAGNMYILAIDNGGDGLIDIESTRYGRNADGFGENIWNTGNGVVTNGNLMQIGFSYDARSINNNPIVYKNAVSQALVYDRTVDHEFGSSNWTQSIARVGGQYESITGIIYISLVYNRILIPTEFSENFNSRGRWYPRDGLIFNSNLCGAKGKQIFDGEALAAGNTIMDLVSGLPGVPSGSPIGISDKVLAGGWK